MGYAYGFFWRCRAINDIAHLTSYRDAIGVPCIQAQVRSFVRVMPRYFMLSVDLRVVPCRMLLKILG